MRVDDVASKGLGRHCSPRHTCRMPFNLRTEDSKGVPITWRALVGCPWAEAQLAASGVLRRMTVRSDWAAAIAQAEGARLLMPLMAAKNDQTRWHAQAALWNISGDAANVDILAGGLLRTSARPTLKLHLLLLLLRAFVLFHPDGIHPEGKS